MAVWRTTCVELSQCLVLLLLLCQIIHFVHIGQLSRLGEFDKERDQPGKVFRLGSFAVVVRQLFEILPSIRVDNTQRDEVLAHEANVIFHKMPTGYTFRIEVADELLGGRASLLCFQLLQFGDTCIPNLEECSHLLILDVSG